jgi:hypothetical protein
MHNNNNNKVRCPTCFGNTKFENYEANYVNIIKYVIVIAAYRILKYMHVIVPQHACREYDLDINMHYLPIIANM